MTFSVPSTRLLWLALATGLALGVVGCSGPDAATSPTELPDAFPEHSPDDIREAIRKPTDSLHSFTADARVKVRSPQQNRSFNADVRQRRADSLFMRFSLFGMEGGRMLLTPDSAFFYDTRNQTLRTGPIAEARHLLPAPVASDETFANMLGIVSPDKTTNWTVEADSARYHLTDPSGRQHWTVDPARWRVVRYTRKDAEGTVLETRQFSEFRTVNGVVLPHEVEFRRPADDVMARLTYEGIRLNPSGLSFKLGAPADLPRKSFGGR